MNQRPELFKHNLEAQRRKIAQLSTENFCDSRTGNFYHGLVNGLAISMVLWGFILLAIAWVVM